MARFVGVRFAGVGVLGLLEEDEEDEEDEEEDFEGVAFTGSAGGFPDGSGLVGDGVSSASLFFATGVSPVRGTRPARRRELRPGAATAGALDDSGADSGTVLAFDFAFALVFPTLVFLSISPTFSTVDLALPRPPLPLTGALAGFSSSLFKTLLALLADARRAAAVLVAFAAFRFAVPLLAFDATLTFAVFLLVVGCCLLVAEALLLVLPPTIAFDAYFQLYW